ncbi:hypothetical protein EYZ11_010260 [Aspergillus tanneri]|uniref:Uncharacterized protein n=1 Tax=Aspergillus tanneri TaxID=1220188 RepID=A0A4V3UN92_9EURO|nr:hypothetical protein EYZ11_010260 [Aspergillus tanneri]
MPQSNGSRAVSPNTTQPDLDDLINENHPQAGTTACSVEEYLSSPHSRANTNANTDINTSHPASWSWTSRLIAGPTISRVLAELGASVMRVASPHVTDLSALH